MLAYGAVHVLALLLLPLGREHVCPEQLQLADRIGARQGTISGSLSLQRSHVKLRQLFLQDCSRLAEFLSRSCELSNVLLLTVSSNRPSITIFSFFQVRCHNGDSWLRLHTISRHQTQHSVSSDVHFHRWHGTYRSRPCAPNEIIDTEYLFHRQSK